MSRFNIRNAYFCNKFHTNSYKAKDNANEFLSTNVRQKFLDYFIKENDHKFVCSSPVMPFCDPTVAFVNAGMNQFKSIFLGQQEPLYKRVANTQKCVRVGGKHNDLNLVGYDGYHHTFFEMLGNWSFGDYFKKEACELSWNLLTGPYGFNPSSLYITYFAGNEQLNLGPDLECKEIWRSLGIADDHILPFGSENFWEMGPVGPCGPCTEIHIDHTGKMNRQNDVNKNLPDLTEIWNIVFIQYNRKIDGNIDLLSKCHIDTGMGLERLTAILQGKSSNYDTDIFTNLFDCIQKSCPGLPDYQGKFSNYDQNGVDTAYRILADHSRMITACLADGMIPEQNQKLRRILRKSMLVSETVFKQEKGLLNKLAKMVVFNLGDVFPEMKKNSEQIQQIISYEEEVYKLIRSTASKEWQQIIEKEPKLANLNILEMPGLVTAYNELISLKNKIISPETAFKMYDTYGLDENTLASLSNALNFNFNSLDLKNQLDLAKLRTKGAFLTTDNLQTISQNLTNLEKTDDTFKYNYHLNNKTYEFDNTDVKLLGILKENKFLNEISSNNECYLILNRTNLYSEAGGQVSDNGEIKFDNKIFKVNETHNINGYILHKGILINTKDNLKVGENGVISINAENRLKLMSNHTTTHLLNAALKYGSKGVTCQKSSKVTPDYLTFDVGIYSKKLSVNDVENVENLIRNVIKKSVEVKTRELNSQQLLNLENVTLVPGEIYPDVGIRLIEIESADFLSREPCCGTHVLNTSSIEDISVISVKSLGRSTSSLTLVSGERAVLARKNGDKILKEVLKLQKSLNNSPDVVDISDQKISKLRHKLDFSIEDDYIIPYTVKVKCVKILNEICKQLKDNERDTLRQFIDLEMASVLELNCNKSKRDVPYLVHYLGCSTILDNVPLSRATKVCANVPVIVLSYSSDEIIKARCCVPKNLASEKFNAEIWLKETVSKVFQSSTHAPKGQDSNLVCNMKAKRISKLEWEAFLEEACKSAKKFADENL